MSSRNLITGLMTIDSSNSWPEELDAMIAAADHHEVLLENERVRVLVSLLEPGDATPVHVHRWPAVLHILGASHFVRYDSRGNPSSIRANPARWARSAKLSGRRHLPLISSKTWVIARSGLSAWGVERLNPAKTSHRHLPKNLEPIPDFAFV